MAKKLFKYQQVVKYRKDHPEATVAEIAKALNANLQYVYKTLSAGKPTRKYVRKNKEKVEQKSYTFTVADPAGRLEFLNNLLAEKDEQIAKLNHVIQYLEHRIHEYRSASV